MALRRGVCCESCASAERESGGSPSHRCAAVLYSAGGALIAFLQSIAEDIRIDAMMREADERGGTFLARLCHAGKSDPLESARVKTSGAGHSRGLQTPAAKSVAVQPVVIGGAAGTCRR